MRPRALLPTLAAVAATTAVVLAVPAITAATTPSTTTSTTSTTTSTTSTSVPPAPVPIAVGDSVTIYANHTATVPVLANDTVPDGTTLALWNGSAAVGTITNLFGTWTVAGDTVVHTPPDGRTGPRSVQYVLTAPGGETSIASVNVQVNSISPPVVIQDFGTTDFGFPITVDVLANDFGGSNREGERYPIVPETLTLSTSTRTPIPSPHVDAAGTWSVVNGGIRFVPAEGFSGNASIRYTFRDSVRQLSPAGSVSITVRANPDAVDDTATSPYGEAVTVDVTANDFTPPGTTIDRISLVAPNGLGANVVEQPGIGTWTFSALDVVFTPADGFVGTASAPYRIVNSRFFTADGVVSVTIEPSEVSAVDDAARITFKQLARVDVAANDTATGPAPDPATVALIGPNGQPTTSYSTPQGTWSVVDGTVTFDPRPSTRGVLRARYEIGNGLDTDTAEVVVTVVKQGGR
jgi:hypothetical protein